MSKDGKKSAKAPPIVRPLILFGVAVSMVTGMALGIVVYSFWPNDLRQPRLGGVVGESIRVIKANYVEAVSEDQLVDDAVRGMLRGLDRYSRYLDPADFESLQADMDGAFGGIGVKLVLREGRCRIVAVIEDSPAAAAGLLPGDQITAIEGDALDGESLPTVVRRLRGPVGSEVGLLLRRDGADLPVHLVRAEIKTPTIDARWLAPGYPHVRILRFNRNTGDEFREAVRRLAKEEPVVGLILDLQGNSGGMLAAAVEVAGALLDGGLVARTEGRSPRRQEEHMAPAGDLINGGPVAVLIDRSSASAAEIVAGALKDHGRAAVLGERSYGKGTVQSVVILPKARGLKLTTAYYFTPSGTPIHENGIDPDIPAVGDPEAILAQALAWLKDSQPLLAGG